MHKDLFLIADAINSNTTNTSLGFSVPFLVKTMCATPDGPLLFNDESILLTIIVLLVTVIVLVATATFLFFPLRFNLMWWVWFQVEWKHNTIGVSKNSRHFVVPCVWTCFFFSQSILWASASEPAGSVPTTQSQKRERWELSHHGLMPGRVE